MSNNTIVRGLLVPSLKNKPLDGRQDVPTLADIVNIENPYVNFIFPVEETGKWYKVLSLTDKVVDELVIPNGMIDEYEEFGGGMTDTQKQEYLTKSLAEQMYLKKEDAVNEYLNKTEAEADYLKKKDAEESYQPKGNYQPSGDYATKQELEDLENRISQGGGSGEGGGGSFIDAPSDNEVYGRKNGLWEKLVDAPKDGKAYARINGVWSPIESGNALDPMLPVLSLVINSTREEDVTIASAVVHVAYADKEFVLGNGGKMNVPYGLDVTVTFPNVENYTTPESVLFEDVQGDISAEGTYTYLKESLDVYVSADDGSSVDGQIVSMVNSRELNFIKNGVYIEDTNGHIYTKESWTGEGTINSILVISDKIKARIGGTSKETDYGLSTGLTPKYATADEAIEDLDSSDNSKGYSSTFSWANGDRGVYLASLGELNMLSPYWEEVMALSAGIWNDFPSSFSSTSYSTEEYTSAGSTYIKAYSMNMLTGDISVTSKGTYLCIKKLTPEDKFRLRTTESKEVLGGKASFDVLIGDEVTVSINAKEGGYSKPEDVSFVVGQGGKNVSFVYNKLMIDTIYINNSIADTSAIISGEMDGPAVNAIFNNVHRYLGKVVTKDDGGNELVLLDINQDDNRYYADGSAIDLEGLGTNAYFITVIPSMAYKITQMSENIYKVEISYKHKPEGEGWKFFNEMVMPTFDYVDTNYTPQYYKEIKSNNITNFAKMEYLQIFDMFNYSNVILLIYAKYGVKDFESKIELNELNEFQNADGMVVNGFSLKTGIKNAAYRNFASTGSAENLKFSILGVESLIYNRRTLGGHNTTNVDLPDSNGIVLNSNYLLKVTGNDDYLETTVTSSAINNLNNAKSLVIDDYFISIAKEKVSASDVYYGEAPGKLNNADGYRNKVYGLIGSTSSSNTTDAYVSKFKIKCPYRIESDRDVFNELTNIWV